MASPEPMKREKKRGEAEIYVKGSSSYSSAALYNNWERIETRWQRSAIDGKIKGRVRSCFDAVVIVSSLGGIAWVGGTQRESHCVAAYGNEPRCTGWRRRASRRHEKSLYTPASVFTSATAILSISLSSIFLFSSFFFFILSPHLLIFTHSLSLSLSLSILI